MLLLRPLAISLLGFGLCAAQDGVPMPVRATPPPEEAPVGAFPINPGTVVPLSLINSISTKHSMPGDRVYLETAFPILANGRIVIPVGSYVEGTVTQIKKPGRVKGRGELYVRFDSLTLPNGVTRDFRARMSGMDGSAPGTLDRTEGKVIAEGNRAGDLRTIGEAAGSGASVGGITGSIAGHPGAGVAIGAAAGAAAGLIGVLVSRGPDAVLTRGSTVEMVLDRQLSFNESELNFGNYQPPRASANAAGDPAAPNGPPVMRRIPK